MVACARLGRTVRPAAGPAPSFSAPTRLGFQQGDDWEPAIAADRSGHVYAVWSHYVGYAGANTGEPDPTCPTCASPHTILQVSSDDGNTWSAPRALWPSTERQDDPQIVVDAADGRTVYASFMQNNKSSQYVARSDDVSQPVVQCGCPGWDYWGPQMALAVDAKDRVYVLWDAAHTNSGIQRLYLSRSVDGASTWSTPRDVSLAPAGANHLFPALAARGDGDVRIAWMDDRNGFDTGNDDPNGRWNVYYRSSADGGATWSAEAKLSQYVPGYPYKYATPQDGFAEPYGDYFEVDVDGAGVTHAIWGEGPSYVGPGNVWYAGGR